MTKVKAPGTVAAVERALRLLEAFNANDRAVTLADLEERTGLYKSTILRLASTLERFGYLARSPSGAYRIGHAPLRLAALYLRTTQPSERILPFLERLVQATQESASFTIRQNDTAICLYRIDSPHIVRDHVRPGDAHPLGIGASGKAILAFTKPYDAKYAQIRRDGVAVSTGELTPDFASVAAPVFDAQGVAGALSLSGPSNRFGAKAVAAMKSALLDAARNVSGALGADPSVVEPVRTSRAKRRR